VGAALHEPDKVFILEPLNLGPDDIDHEHGNQVADIKAHPFGFDVETGFERLECAVDMLDCSRHKCFFRFRYGPP
jgi:hypothetical protein